MVDTPLKNKFEALDTEEALQTAFDNLQNLQKQIAMTHGGNKPTTSTNNLELVLMDNADQYLSDGAGAKDKSNIGVQFCSAPNSDGEQDIPTEARIRTRKSKKNY